MYSLVITPAKLFFLLSLHLFLVHLYLTENEAKAA